MLIKSIRMISNSKQRTGREYRKHKGIKNQYVRKIGRKLITTHKQCVKYDFGTPLKSDCDLPERFLFCFNEDLLKND